MKKSKGAKAISKLARRKGVSEAEIRKEIQIAIDMGMANPDPNARALWEEMMRKGIKPTPDEFIVYMAERVKRKL